MGDTGAMLRAFLTLLLLIVALADARAAVLSEDGLRRLLPAGVTLGAKEADLPAWPLLRDGALAGYIFETNDLVRIPGFTGTPIDLLVAMDKDGGFLDVEVLEQNEPVFVDGLGVEPFVDFLRQYRGLSIRQNIKVSSVYGGGDRSNSTAVTLDGITKATASVRIANVTILAASLKVARAKLAGVAPAEAARVRADVRDSAPWDAHLGHLRLTGREVEAAFAGTRFAGLDSEATAKPDEPVADLRFGLLTVPTVGIALLGEEGWRRVMARLEPWEHAVIVMSSGRWSFTGEDFVRGTVPDRLALRQGNLPIPIRDADAELEFLPGVPGFGEAKLFRVDGRTGFDPASPWTLSLRVTRQRGSFRPETESRDFPTDYRLPERFFEREDAEGAPSWRASWTARAGELGVLGAGLALLAVLLARPAVLTRNPRVFAWVRRLYLAYTLVFVGWVAQAQLSIVNVLALVKAAGTGMDLSFFLYDPPTLVVWGFALGALAVWGRGTFCGWLCPFGALQEFAADVAARLGARQIAVPAWLENVKYGVLAVLVGGTALSTGLAETLAEAEPFKTAITLGFRREWPFVVYAVLAVLASTVVFKGYCRFVCPLGAALALLGRLRRFDWIARRTECGTPCQLCRRKCRYGAIRKDGAIRYHECFQCLDCVAIHQDAARCVPLVLSTKRAARETCHAD
ncbi:4Fe-4S binding protein [Azospirillum sp. sgz301742]